MIQGKSRTKSGLRLHHFLMDGKGGAYGAWMVPDGKTETCVQPNGEVIPVGTIFTIRMLALTEWEDSDEEAGDE